MKYSKGSTEIFVKIKERKSNKEKKEIAFLIRIKCDPFLASYNNIHDAFNILKHKIMPSFVFVSSNQQKIKEYSLLKMNLTFEAIDDLPEVAGSDLDVIKYKALALPHGYIIEDTSLTVEGCDIGTLIKFKVNSLKTDKTLNGRKLEWKVMAGLRLHDKIFIVESTLHGVLNNDTLIPDAFAFDDIFFIDGRSLYELKQDSNSFLLNPRRIVMEKIFSCQYDYIYNISDIHPWNGTMQNEK